MCMSVQVHVLHVHMEARGHLRCYSSCLFGDNVAHWSVAGHVRLVVAAPQGSSRLCVSDARITKVCHHTRFFSHGLWRSNPGLIRQGLDEAILAAHTMSSFNLPTIFLTFPSLSIRMLRYGGGEN